MKRSAALLALALLVTAGGCGPSVSSDGDGADFGDAATLRGVVWAPGNAPGMVPPGHEIPVASALVYVSVDKPEPIPQQTYCEECVEDHGGVLTDHRGVFSLAGIAPGTYWLVVQKGQFRRETSIVVEQPGEVEMAAGTTTLPSVQDAANGQWIPRIALASGSYDALETILGKLGIGGVDAGGNFVAGSARGKFDVYSNGGSIDSVAIGSLSQLAGDLDRMLQYHIIFIPCSASLFNGSALKNQTVLRNLRDYVAAGGKLYVTDWSGEWADNVFPAQVQLRNLAVGPFGGATDTPSTAYDAGQSTWDTSKFGDADGLTEYDSPHAEAVDDALRSWLNGQEGPTANGAAGLYSAADFTVTGNYNYIDRLNSVELGVDGDGAQVVDQPRTYLAGDDGTTADKWPLTVTFEPAGCGRVMYSTYHTTDSVHTGLVPQERVLVYLIMEIGLCHAGPVVE